MKSRLVRTLAAGAILAATTQAAWSAEFEWKYFTIYDVADKQTEWGREFAKAVKDATGGRIEIKVFSGSELPYKGVDVYRALSRRQIEIGHSATGFVAQDLPLVNVMSMPFVCTDMRKFFDVALPKVRNTLDQALFDKFKVRALMHWTMPGQQVWSTKPIKTAADFKGLKIRTWNREQVATLTKLGASSASITTAEVTPALQRGIVDGAFTASINAAAWNWSQVLKNGYMMNITLAHEVISVNAAALDELPPDLRKTFLEVSAAWEGKFRANVFKLDEEARETLVKQGMTLVDPNEADAKALRDMTLDIGTAWAEANGAAAAQVLAGVRDNCR